MKLKYGYLLALAVVLLLDFAALDDITTGREPDFYLEYGIILLSLLVITIFAYLIFRLDKNIP